MNRLLIRFFQTTLAAFFICNAPGALAQDSKQPPLRWWKGNLHTHSLWSDGDDYPEMITAWYKDNGYHFLTLSDHNVLSEGQRWVNATNNKGGEKALHKYLERYGSSWVELREKDGERQVRLKPFNEFRPLFDEPDRFLLMQAEEVSARSISDQRSLPIHINASNIRDVIIPQSGTTAREALEKNVNAIVEQRRSTGQTMLPHVNHPNFGWALSAEDLMQVEEARFFEVYNGHPGVRNWGDDLRAGTERIWDIALTKRLAELGFGPLFGLGTDDAHNYHEHKVGRSNTGRGWIMVRAARLTPENILHAMEAGDFYASNGVTLKDVQASASHLTVSIDPEPGVTYRTQFIGTRRGYKPQGETVLDSTGNPVPTTLRYGPEIGAMLAEVEGATARYVFKGDEIYVRAKVISSKVKDNPFQEGEMEMAWTQPVVGGGGEKGEGRREK